MNMSCSGYLGALLGALVWLLVPLCAAAADDIDPLVPAFLMDSDPELTIPQSEPVFNPALKSLWLAALDRPEIDMQRMAAETIARAHQFGVPELNAAVPRLEALLVDDSSHPAVRFAAGRALIVLDSHESAQKLFEASQTHGADLRQLVEPALAQWDYLPIIPVWNARLEAADTRHRDLVLALRGLGAVRDTAALPQLLAITHDLTRDADVRLEAATAAGAIAESGLESDAGQLAHRTQSLPIVNQLCAVRLLARHESEDAKQLLSELATQPTSAVVAAALHRLNVLDPSLVALLAETAIKSGDPHVRQEAAAAWLKLPTADRITALAQLLADPHPAVRHQVGEGLYRLAQSPEWNEPIRTAAMNVLAGDGWQGQEQAALLLGALEHKPAAERLVELLESSRQEVQTASAWALRSVANPDVVPAMIDYARRQTERRKTEEVPGLDDQIAHLFEAFGVMQSADALPLLVEYIPKNKALGERSRSAAIWAIGRIKAGTRDAELESALVDRLTDFPEKNPESPLVQQMCAIALTRMNAVEEASTMRGVAESQVIPVRLGVALRWGVKELTGEEMTPPTPPPADTGDWFLEPLP